VLDFLPDGEPVEVVAFSADGEWSQIQRPRVGWVNNDFLLFKSQDATQTSIQLNVQPRRTQPYEVAVRAAPNANAEITTRLDPDVPVVVATTMGEPPMWVQIAHPTIGWIAANDLAPVSP
jgi:SH3-like domain-containing protein